MSLLMHICVNFKLFVVKGIVHPEKWQFCHYFVSVWPKNELFAECSSYSFLY